MASSRAANANSPMKVYAISGGESPARRTLRWFAAEGKKWELLFSLMISDREGQARHSALMPGS
jgi:hypothetical protein